MILSKSLFTNSIRYVFSIKKYTKNKQQTSGQSKNKQKIGKGYKNSIQQIGKSYNKSKQQIGSKSIQQIIQCLKKDNNFAYRQSRLIFNSILNSFKQISQRKLEPFKTLFQLNKLVDYVHLSSFSSWKQLNQFVNNIQPIINNQEFIDTLSNNKDNKNYRMLIIIQILNFFNYQLSQTEYFVFINNFVQSTNLKDDKYHFKYIRVIFNHSILIDKIVKDKQLLQSKIIKQIEQNQMLTRQIEIDLSEIVKSGVYINYWSKNFIQKIFSIIRSNQYKYIQQGLISCLQSIMLSYPQLDIKQNAQWITIKSSQTSKSQSEISNILSQLDYPFQTDQCLFNYQVDYLINNKYIIQFHGIHHYVSNSQYPPRETVRSKWKEQAFRNRGYKYCVIPSYQWAKVQTPYEKKKYLINRIQNFIIQSTM